jgi:hypothetical protein
MKEVEAINYRGLWSAVILQAFVDMRCKSFKTPKPIIKPTGNRHEDKLRYIRALRSRSIAQQGWDNTRKSAKRWLLSEDTHPRSFIWICDSLGLDARRLRQMSATSEGIERVLTGKAL